MSGGDGLRRHIEHTNRTCRSRPSMATQTLKRVRTAVRFFAAEAHALLPSALKLIMHLPYPLSSSFCAAMREEEFFDALESGLDKLDAEEQEREEERDEEVCLLVLTAENSAATLLIHTP